MKKLVLKQHQIGEKKFHYRVMQVGDSTTPKVGDALSEAQAASYCNNAAWTVTIKGE